MRFSARLFVTLMLTALAVAQAPGISGRVRDGQGRALAGVEVELSRGGRHLEVRSGADGRFFLPAEPGIWTLRATRSGHPSLAAGPLTLQPGDALLITWTPRAARLELEAAAGHSETVKTLPLRGQAASELDTLVPGTGATGGTAGAFSVNGNRSAYNTYLVSGANDLDPFRQEEAIGQGGAFGAPAVLIPLGAVENMQVLTNAGAPYTPSGAVLITSLRSGGAALHGSLFDYFDNRVLAANNFYNNVYGRPRQVFRNNQFGFTVGGPLPLVGGHAFASVEAQREAVGVTFASRLPSPQDIAAAEALVTQSGHTVNPLGQTVLAQYPAALGSGPLSFSDLGLNNGNTMVLKFDHDLGAQSSFSAAYILGDNRQTFPQGRLGQGGGSRLPAYSSLSPTRVQLLSLQWRHAGASGWSEQAAAGYSRFYELTLPSDQGFDPASIGLETGAPPSDGGLPEIDIAPGYYENLGASSGMPRGRVSDVYDYSASAQHSAGSQQWTLGGEWMGLQENAYNDNGFRGYLLFNGSQLGDSLTPSFGLASLVDVLAGLPAPGATAIARGNSQRYVRQKRWGAFVQDQWQLAAPLQLTLGLRYDRYGVPTESQNRFSNFVPGTGLVPVGPGGLATLYQPNTWDFSPRAAAAWNLSGGRILRGGWGLYFDPASFDQVMDDANSNSVVAGPLYNPLGASAIFSATPAAPVPFGPGVAIFGQAAAPQPPFDAFAVARDFPDPRVQVYHVALEQLLGRANSLTVAYYGSDGIHLAAVLDANQPTPGPAGAAAEQARRPLNAQFPQFRVLNTLTAEAHSNYNSLQISARSQGIAGLSVQASYTWSKSLDDSSGAGGYSGGLPEDSRNLAADYGPSNFDQRQRLSLTYAYALPFAAWAPGWRVLTAGWQLNGITTFATGSPFTVTMASDNSGTGEFHDRPDLIGNPHMPFSPTGSYLNPAAFAAPPAGTYGNLGRNTFYGPGLSNFDLSLIKTTSLAGDRTLRLRAEFFNAFNHPNFASPSATFGSGFHITSTPDVFNPYFGSGGPRDVQLVAEILF